MSLETNAMATKSTLGNRSGERLERLILRLRWFPCGLWSGPIWRRQCPQE